MADTVVHTAENVVDGTVTGLAGAVGSLTNETAHHAEQLAAHAEQLANIGEDARWIKERLSNLETAITEAPSAAIGELRTEMETLRRDLTEQTAALSDAIVSTTTEEPQTDPPPPQTNEAILEKPTGPIGSLRKALHRLL